MTDEDIIKGRLIIDGDGTGDDRRLNIMLKQFIKWSNSKNETDNHVVFDRMMAQLAQCKFAVSKSYLAEKMIEDESKNYQKVSRSISKSIEVAKKEINISKQKLSMAKEIRRHKMEYDLLAKVIKEQPDRVKTSERIVLLKKEVNELIEKRTKFERKFKKRISDFELLMYALQELQATFEEDSSSDSKSDIDLSNNLMDLSDDDMPISSHNIIYDLNLNGQIKDENISDNEHVDDNLNTFPLCKDSNIEEDIVLELSIEKDDTKLE